MGETVSQVDTSERAFQAVGAQGKVQRPKAGSGPRSIKGPWTGATLGGKVGVKGDRVMGRVDEKGPCQP